MIALMSRELQRRRKWAIYTEQIITSVTVGVDTILSKRLYSIKCKLDSNDV